MQSGGRVERRFDVVGPESRSALERVYRDMISDPLVATLDADVNDWENQRPIRRHNDAVHLLHKLVFAAGIGVRAEQLKTALGSIRSHQSDEGPFQVRIVIPRSRQEG